MLCKHFQVPFSCFRSPAPARPQYRSDPAEKGRRSLTLLSLASLWSSSPSICAAQQPSEHTPFHALAFYTTKGEQDHIDFALQALRFYGDLAKKDNFSLASTTDWNDMSADKLKDVQLVIWLNDFPHTPEQRKAFEDYMNNGGAWLGFHVAAYNDEAPTGHGSSISSVVPSSLGTIGRRCRRNWLLMTALIRLRRACLRLLLLQPMSGTSGNRVLV